jgi:hypothetical protein
MSQNHFIGREDGLNRLKEFFQGNSKLSILSIEGPGGIGKTTLFEHMMGQVEFDSQKLLTLHIDGNKLASNNLQSAISKVIDGAKFKDISKKYKTPRELFPNVQSILASIDDVKEQAMRELKDKGDENSVFGSIQEILDLAITVGININEGFPKTAEYANFKSLGLTVEKVNASLPLISSLKMEAASFFNRLGLNKSFSLRNSIRENAVHSLAMALYGDLTTILSGYEASSIREYLTPRLEKIKDVDNLLFIIDDYEVAYKSLDHFLTSEFLNMLASAKFNSKVVIIGRDKLSAVNPSWDQHLSKYIFDAVEIQPLSRPELEQLLAMYNITASAELERAWSDTEGYPFYVQLWVEELRTGGRTALTLKRFYERTTRWMSKQEKEWLSNIIYLEVVNKRTLTKMFQDEEQARSAYKWFESEGSVRSVTGKYFRVREYLRSRLVDYIEVSDPDLHEKLSSKADPINRT